MLYDQAFQINVMIYVEEKNPRTHNRFLDFQVVFKNRPLDCTGHTLSYFK